MELFSKVLTAAYTGTGFVDIIGFLPQIYVLVMATGLSKGISLRTWSLWSGTALIAVLYAAFIVKDLYMTFVTGVDFVGCFTVFCIATYNRYFRFTHLSGKRKDNARTDMEVTTD